jgi:hypothetical protein
MQQIVFETENGDDRGEREAKETKAKQRGCNAIKAKRSGDFSKV